MSFAFGHLFWAWLSGKGYEKLTGKIISHPAWLFLLLGGILPDADFLFDWALGTDIHRTITHSLIFFILAPVLLYASLKLLSRINVFLPISAFLDIKKTSLKSYSGFLAVGIAVHLFLDMFYASGIQLFWPSNLFFSYFHVGRLADNLTLFEGSAEKLALLLKGAVLDMAIGTFWIFYLAVSKRVRF